MASVPLPPRRGDGAAPTMAPVQQNAAPVMNEGPIDMLGGLGEDIGKFLEGLLGQAFGGGGQTQYPGYTWDGFQGWVPDKAAAPPAPAPVAPEFPKSTPGEIPLPPRRPSF